MLTSDPVIINNGSYISSPPMCFRCNIQRCSNHNPIHPFDFIIYEPKPWTCLNGCNITIQEEKLQVQAGRVCRADHPTYSLHLSLCLFLRKKQSESKLATARPRYLQKPGISWSPACLGQKSAHDRGITEAHCDFRHAFPYLIVVTENYLHQLRAFIRTVHSSAAIIRA